MPLLHNIHCKQGLLDLRKLWCNVGSLPLRQGLSEQLARTMLVTSKYPDAIA